jgi:hypothetical protein
MQSLALLAQSLGLAYASGVSLYATVAFVGIAQRLGWIGPLPGALSILADSWVLGFACALLALEVLASLVPVVATTWEGVHTALRPFGAGAVAVLATWGNGPRTVVVAALLGSALGLATHATKLGLRAAIDTSPEPFSNAAATTAELGVVAAMAWAVWHHPWLSLMAALALLVVLFVAVRALWRAVRRAWSGALRGPA